LLLAAAAGATPIPPDPADKAEHLRAELIPPRAVLQITREDGVCLWRISGDDELVRLPVKDERFGAILLSARFEDDHLLVTLAGEKEPLETLPLGRYTFSLGERDSQPLMVSELKSRRSDAWQLKVVPPGTKAVVGCCSCPLVKLTCCPNYGKCLSCSNCGECCNP
jgi:hypothetical protein